MKRNIALEYTILIALAFVWGSSFILMKRGLLSFNAVQIGTYRMFIAGIILLPVFLSYLKRVPKKALPWFFLSGLFGNGLPAIMFPYAQTHLSSSLAGALNALTPLFTLLIGLLVFRIRLSTLKSVGVMIGLAGAVLLILMKDDSQISGDIRYTLILVLAAAFYGVNVNVIKQKLSDNRPMVVAAFPVVFMAVPSLFYLLYEGFFTSLTFEGVQMESLIYISILGIFGTALSLIAFNNLIQRSSAVFASSVTYLMPVVALLWGIWDNEHINMYQLIGLVLVIGGVILVNRPAPAVKAPEAKPTAA